MRPAGEDPILAVSATCWAPSSPTGPKLPYSWRVQAKDRRTASWLVDTGLWVASLALLALSFVFSWGPPPPSPDVGWFDKVWHFLGYGALCETLLLAAVWRPGRGPGRFPRAGLLIGGLVLLVAWLTEALQAPFGRDVQLTDALADLAGVLSGLMGWRAISGGAAPASPPGSGRRRSHTTRPSIPE